MERRRAWMAGLLVPAVGLLLYGSWPESAPVDPAPVDEAAAKPVPDAPTGVRPGVRPGQLTVFLAPDADPGVLSDLPVLRTSTLAGAVRVAASPEQAPEIRAREGVRAVVPAVDYALRRQPSDSLDPPNPGYAQAGVREAWDALDGRVGSRRVRVAIVGAGVDYTHPDLYLNIGIHQPEIPFPVVSTCGPDASCALDDRGVPRCTVCDVDDDGLVTFADLNALPNAPGPGAPCDPERFVACDHNGNGYVDAGDLLVDPTWTDGRDDDGNGLVDDLVGWNFAEGHNDPMPGTVDHETAVAGLVGAVPRNGRGIAGVAWEVSLVPLAVAVDAPDEPVVPDVSFADAARYAEATGVDVVNASLGWELVAPDADTGCADPTERHPWTPHRDDLLAAFDAVPFRLGGRALYVFAAGNRGLALSDPATAPVLDVPSQLLDAVAPERVLLVGGSRSRRRHDPGSNHGPAVDLYAPARNWHTLSGRAEVARYSGTSMSAAVVTGAAALVASRHPGLSGRPEAIADRLLGTPADLDVVVSCRGSEGFRGLARHVDAASAVR